MKPSRKLSVQIYNRGKEVFGINYDRSEFIESEFIDEHYEDYFELSDESVESEIPINRSHIQIFLDNDEQFHEQFNDGNYAGKIIVEETDERESYRSLINSTDNEVSVIWFYDYVNALTCEWEISEDFDHRKLTVYSKIRIDDTDNTEYKILSHLRYDGRDPQKFDMNGTPKVGYSGPYIILP